MIANTSKQDRETARREADLVRWSLLAGAALANAGFHTELFDAIEPADACSEWHTSLLAGIKTGSKRQVMGVIASRFGDALDEETALQVILRITRSRVADDKIKRVIDYISNPGTRGMTPLEYVEFASEQIASIRRYVEDKRSENAARKQAAG